MKLPHTYVMRGALSLLCFLCLVCESAGQGELPFNCNFGDSTHLCENGGICLADGSCDCSAVEFNGQTCSVPQADWDNGCTDPAPSCAGGHCYVNGSVNTCECAPGYIHTEGECKPRVRVITCSATSITFTVTSYNNTNVVIGLGGSEEAICLRNPNIDIQTNYADGGCSDPAVDTTANPIQYKALIWYASASQVVTGDGKYLATLSCNIPAPGQDITMNSASASIDIQSYSPPEITATAVNAASGFKLTLKSAGTALSGPVALRDPLELEIVLSITSSSFVAFMVKIIEGKSSLDSDGVTLVSEGCVMHSPVTVTGFEELAYVDGITQVARLTFQAFYMKGSTSLILSVTLEGCDTENCAGRRGAACSPGAENQHAIGRKKRQADDAVKQLPAMNVSAVVLAYDKTYKTGPSSHVPLLSSTCLQSTVFLLPVILLSICLILVIFVAVYFCLKLTRLNRYQDKMGKANPRFKDYAT